MRDLKQFIKTTIKEFLNENNELFGYRNTKSNKIGKYGTFYNVKKPNSYDTNKVKLNFKNPLIIDNNDIYNFEGLSLEYLFWKWFPELEDTYQYIAKEQGIETSELIDKIVTVEAIKRGYDGIIMGDLEIIDLTTHPKYR
jgi:hypothetical protein